MSDSSHEEISKMSSSVSRTTLSSLESVATHKSFSSSTMATVAKTAKGSVRYKWSSNWEFIALQLACFLTVESFFVMPVDLFAKSRYRLGGKAKHHHSPLLDPSTVLNFVFFYIAIGIPVVYMQVVVGQYSQLGVLFFKYLTPIGHGIGFLMCINTFWSCINQGVNMGDVSLYFLSAMETELPWMKCPKDHEKCWVFDKACVSNCLTPEKNLSAFVFWSEMYMGNIDLEPNSFKYTAPILARAVVVGVGWAIVYALTRMRISKYRKIVIVNLYLAAVLCTLLVFVCILEQGGSKGLELFNSTDWRKMLNPEGWTSVVVCGVKLLGLGRACYVVYGSYMDFKTPSNILTIAYVCFNLFWVFFGCVLIFASMGIIADKSNTPVVKLKHILFAPMPQFIVLPQAFGYLGAPQLWTTIYFLLTFLLLINHQVTQVEIVERCITDLNYRFKHYSDYILGTLCLIGVLCGIVLVSKDSFVVHSVINAYVVVPIKVFTVAIMCTLICWVYGVQHFSDDIHFMVGAQPAKYWKILWYTIPVGLWLGTIHTLNHLNESTTFIAISFIFGAIYICPLPIMAIIAIFQQLKGHNLIGLVQAQERWGPPDPQERHLRHLFNPREETRSRRRNDSCTHKCFIRSKILVQAIREQDLLRITHDDYNINAPDSRDDESDSEED